MCDHDEGLPLGNGFFKEGEARGRRYAVEVTGGFVAHEERGVVCQGTGDGHALLLSAGERVGEFVRLIKARLFEDVHHAFRAFPRFPYITKIHREHNILDDGQRREQLKN